MFQIFLGLQRVAHFEKGPQESEGTLATFARERLRRKYKLQNKYLLYKYKYRTSLVEMPLVLPWVRRDPWAPRRHPGPETWGSLSLQRAPWNPHRDKAKVPPRWWADEEGREGVGVPHAHQASDGHKVDHLVQHRQSEGIEIHILRLIRPWCHLHWKCLSLCWSAPAPPKILLSPQTENIF